MISETNYSYKGGLFDYETREFRGFKEVIKTNPNGSTQKTAFYQGDDEQPDDPADLGDQFALKNKINYVEARETSDETSPNNLISHMDYQWGLRNETPGSQFVYLDKKVTTSYDKGVDYQVVYEDNIEFDAWGNLLRAKTWDRDGTAEAVTVAFNYTNLGTDLAPLWRKSMEQVLSGPLDKQIRQVFYRYTADGRGNLEEKELVYDNISNPILRYAYDAYGNLWKEWDAKNQLVAEYTYDTATHTYPVAIINALGHTVTKEWDARYGKEKWVQDANDNRTVFGYDEFGRINQVDRPDGGQTLYTYKDTAAPNDPRHVFTQVKENSRGDWINSYTFYDGLDRKIQKLTFGEIGQTIVQRITYDTMGRVSKEEGPFYGFDSVYPQTAPAEYPWTEHFYDQRGRPILSQSPEGLMLNKVEMKYNGLATTVIDPDLYPKTATMDYLGRVVKVTETHGLTPMDTFYEYNAVGELKTVTDPQNNQTVINYDSLGRKIDMSDPNMGYWTYDYDPNGNLKLQTDAKGQQVEFDYDALNRITAKRYLNPTPYDNNVTYTYDDAALTLLNPIGKLSQQTNGVATTTFERYDPLGKVTKATKAIAGYSGNRTTWYQYDLSGKLEHMVYPDNTKVNYFYHPGANLLQSVSDVTNMVNYVTYSDYPATGKIKEALFGNNTTTSYTYDANSARLTGIRAMATPTNAIIDKIFSYSAAGDIEVITDNRLGYSRIYAYDSLHRLESETNGGGTDQFDFTYDAIGNMTSRSAGADRLVFTQDPTRPHVLQSVSVNGINAGYTYDANGNMLSGPDLNTLGIMGTRTLEYNTDNMPARITHSSGGTTRLYYDGNNKRAKKTTSAGNTFYFGEHYEIQNGVACKFIFAGRDRIAMNKGGATLYFHKDHLGSSTAITDATGAILEQADYMPFGGQRGGQTITSANYKFTDQEWDSETGLYNYDARLYDPAIGRFVTADSFVPNPFNPQHFNRYSYCYNNPIRYIDPTGHWGGDPDDNGLGDGVAGNSSGASDTSSGDPGGNDSSNAGPDANNHGNGIAGDGKGLSDIGFGNPSGNDSNPNTTRKQNRWRSGPRPGALPGEEICPFGTHLDPDDDPDMDFNDFLKDPSYMNVPGKYYSRRDVPADFPCDRALGPRDSYLSAPEENNCTYELNLRGRSGSRSMDFF